MRGFIAFFLLAIAFYRKARKEEEWLAREFGEKFRTHYGRTGMFLPPEPHEGVQICQAEHRYLHQERKMHQVLHQRSIAPANTTLVALQAGNDFSSIALSTVAAPVPMSCDGRVE